MLEYRIVFQLRFGCPITQNSLIRKLRQCVPLLFLNVITQNMFIELSPQVSLRVSTLYVSISWPPACTSFVLQRQVRVTLSTFTHLLSSICHSYLPQVPMTLFTFIYLLLSFGPTYLSRYVWLPLPLPTFSHPSIIHTYLGTSLLLAISYIVYVSFVPTNLGTYDSLHLYPSPQSSVIRTYNQFVVQTVFFLSLYIYISLSIVHLSANVFFVCLSFSLFLGKSI